MITFKLNGKPLNIPSNWQEVTFAQYIQVMEMKESENSYILQLISIFTGQDYETLKKAIISGLDKILETLSFINTPPVFPGSVSECGPYKIPTNSKGQFNIQYESLGQFEDMRQAFSKVKDLTDHTKAYSKYVAIYLQKIRDKVYDPLKVPDLEAEIQSFPAYQVITLGAFFFLKLRSSLNGTGKTSPPSAPSQKKKAFKNSHRSSVRTRK